VTPPVALTIAGSDSSGGAGIQADLKTFAALGVFGTSAITALTAQNTRGVRAVRAVPADFVVAQVEAVLDDLDVRAVKTGMLATVDVVHVVAELAGAGRLPQLVVDPVMISSSGDRLLEDAAERAYLDELIPYATVLTPNLRETEVLLEASIDTLEDQRAAARALGALGPSMVVVKGGHAVRDAGGLALDVVWDGAVVRELNAPRVETTNNHGSGCSFASAISAGLASGLAIWPALQQAKLYVWAGISGGAEWQLGGGPGPLDHFGWDAAAPD